MPIRWSVRQILSIWGVVVFGSVLLGAPATATAWQVFNTNTGAAGTVAVRTSPNSSATFLYNITLGAGGILSTGERATGYASFIGGNATWLYVNDGRGWGWSFDEGGGYDTYYATGAITGGAGASPAAPGNGAYTTDRRPTVSWSAWDNDGNALDAMNLHVWKATGGDYANGAVGNVRAWAYGADMPTGLYYWTVQPHSWINGWGGWFGTQSFFVDYTGPVTTSNAVASYSGTATIVLTGTDESGGSGRAHTYYKVDAGGQSEGLTVGVSAFGSHTLEYWSTDNAGNSGPHSTVQFTVNPIDGSKPITVASVSASYPGTATIRLTASDTGSGVAHTYYVADAHAQVEGTSVIISGIGSHTLSYWSVDGAGNIEVRHDVALKIAAPKASKPSVSRRSANHGTAITVSGYISARFAAGKVPVRVQVFFCPFGGSSWKSYGTKSDSVSSASGGRSYFSLRYKLPKRGWWYFRTYTVADSTHYRSSTSSASYTVRAN